MGLHAPLMIVGLVGRRGVGKDTVADHLCERYGFVNLKFAGPLKEAIKALFGLTSDHVDGPLKEVVLPAWGVSPRRLMQFFGTEVMQMKLQELLPHVGTSHAVRRLQAELDRMGPVAHVVVSDVRFTHEVDALLARDALIVEIRRHCSGPSSPGSEVDAHVSEAGVDRLFSHLQLSNDGTIDQLLAGVDRFVRGVVPRA